MRLTSILTGPESYLDHLGILSIGLGIPLIVTEHRSYESARKYYPQLDVTYTDYNTLSLEYLATHFDVIFETGKFFAAELQPILQLLFHKTMRFVFCPHGNSDKGDGGEGGLFQDIALVYGDHLLDRLTHAGATHTIQHVLRTGNYRYSYYLKHKNFYDTLALKEVFCHFNTQKPIILYAPTWDIQEGPTSFFHAIDTLISSLTPSFQLLVKLHPFLIENAPALIYSILGRYDRHPSVHFLTHFPPIYPLLNHCAIYLGDYSSVGYDFLAFDKPLYFLQETNHHSALRACGLNITPEQLPFIGQLIQDTQSDSLTRFRTDRQNTYVYAFGQERSMQELKEELIQVLHL